MAISPGKLDAIASRLKRLEAMKRVDRRDAAFAALCAVLDGIALRKQQGAMTARDHETMAFMANESAKVGRA